MGFTDYTPLFNFELCGEKKLPDVSNTSVLITLIRETFSSVSHSSIQMHNEFKYSAHSNFIQCLNSHSGSLTYIFYWFCVYYLVKCSFPLLCQSVVNLVPAALKRARIVLMKDATYLSGSDSKSKQLHELKLRVLNLQDENIKLNQLISELTQVNTMRQSSVRARELYLLKLLAIIENLQDKIIIQDELAHTSIKKSAQVEYAKYTCSRCHREEDDAIPRCHAVVSTLSLYGSTFQCDSRAEDIVAKLGLSIKSPERN